MRHARSDYEAIQPWPTKRPHFAKTNDRGPTGDYADPTDDGRYLVPIIPDDEPVFILRAKDMTAPDLVHLWADRNTHDPVVAEAIHKWADHMAQYAADNYDGGKHPDTPHENLVQ